MKILSPVLVKKGRIEIIPLIDIMVFLMACMMMVNLEMIRMRGLKLNLPTAQTATPENKADFLTVSITATGEVFLEKEEIERSALIEELKRRKEKEPNLRIYVQADMDARHGDVVRVLDKIRAAGIQKIGFQVKEEASAPKASAGPAPATHP
ncbi:Biopolymer transport protein (fragment) [Methylacidimicrobium sp. AP8]|uniref:ExbD/TolR family protein n=1 Tax=Methylacidimicrobium sp. AP8 TaxID=2730359 RepID=UPI0018C17617